MTSHDHSLTAPMSTESADTSGDQARMANAHLFCTQRPRDSYWKRTGCRRYGIFFFFFFFFQVDHGL